MKELPSENKLKDQIMLTSVNVWNHQISKQDIEEWLTNFKSEVFDISYERQLALWLLANFVYYNDDEVKHLCKTLYRDFIHHMLENKKSTHKDLKLLCNNILSKSKFYPLGRPGESGAYILYYFRQENNLPIDNFISTPEMLPTDIDTIVFVDDVTLSEGSRHSQAFSYLEKTTRKHFKGKKIVLITLIASEKAKRYLQQKGYDVISCIVLDKRNKCFTTESNVFHHFPKHRINCKKFAEHYGSKLDANNPLGYKNGQFLFGFFYNTPDNTLPILWSETNGWKPVIKRYDKNYLKENYAELDRFV